VRKRTLHRPFEKKENGASSHFRPSRLNGTTTNPLAILQIKLDH
jgi:hypothetical protein